MQAMAIITVAQLIFSSLWNNVSILSITPPSNSISTTPTSYSNIIRIATADKNPLKAGTEKIFSINPILKIARIKQKPPIIIERMQASSILS